MKNAKRGMAVPLLLVLLLALTALAHGVLLLSRLELRSARALARALRATEAAEAAPIPGLEGWNGLPPRRVPWIAHPLGAGSIGEGLTFEARLRWLSGELFLLEGVGRVHGWGGEARRGWVGWSLSSAVRMAAMGAVAEVGGNRAGAGPRSESFRQTPEGWPASACSPFDAVLDSLFASGPLSPLGALGSPSAQELGASSPIPPLGLLTGGYLLAMEDVGSVPRGSIGPSPTPHFVAPSPSPDSVSGCPGVAAASFIAREGPLTLRQGRFCGLLVVEGGLRLEGSFRLQGLALVGGDLVLAEDATVEGMARIGGHFRVLDRARMDASACAVMRALDDLTDLRRPYLLPQAAGIHPF